MDDVVHASSIELDPTYFSEQLIQTIPEALIEQNGKVNLPGYKAYLDQMHLKIDAYEARVEQELKRSEVSDFIKQSGYVSKHAAKDFFEQQGAKSFKVLKFPLHKYVQEIQKNVVTDKAIQAYYQANKEAYRIEDKSKAVYITIDTDAYGKAADVDDEAIERFYTKNKESMFKVPLTLKLRRILFALDADALPSVVAEVEKKAREVLLLAQNLEVILQHLQNNIRKMQTLLKKVDY